MAEAYECDRCGKLYKGYDIFALAYQCKKQAIKIYGYEKENDCWPHVWDLCPVCRIEIINMLERKD